MSMSRAQPSGARVLEPEGVDPRSPPSSCVDTSRFFLVVPPCLPSPGKLGLYKFIAVETFELYTYKSVCYSYCLDVCVWGVRGDLAGEMTFEIEGNKWRESSGSRGGKAHG